MAFKLPNAPFRPEPSLQQPGGSEDPILTEWDYEANKVIDLKLVRSVEDLDTEPFHPSLTHQVFENQLIRGYIQPKIKMYYLADSLGLYCNFSYEKKRTEGDITDVVSCLGQVIRHSYHSNLDDFLQQIDKPFTPIGTKIHSYTLESQEAEGEGEVEFEVRKADFSMDGVREYHKRIQTFVLWFIDRSSFIDDEDMDWELYFIFERRRLNGNETYAVVGYSTTYPFFAFPDKKRIRISQVLILPPYQRKGHGEQLLNAMYNDMKARVGPHKAIKDITVEDPSSDFSALRDVTDLRNCHRHGFFRGDVPDILEPNAIKEIQETLRLCKSQVLHLHEVVRFIKLDRSKPEAMASLRLSIKRRLYKKYQDWLEGFEQGEQRKKELEDIYREEIEAVYSAIAHKLQHMRL